MGLKAVFKSTIAEVIKLGTNEANTVLDKVPYIDKIENAIEGFTDIKDAYSLVMEVLDSAFSGIELKYFIAGIQMISNYKLTPLNKMVEQLTALAIERGEELTSEDKVNSVAVGQDIFVPSSTQGDFRDLLRASKNDDPTINFQPSNEPQEVINTADIPSFPVGSSLIFESPPKINIDAINEKIIIHNIVHIGISISIATIQVLAEVATVGFIDEVLPALSMVYNLFPSSNVYNQVLAIETETSLIRPFRYAKEAEHVTQLPPLTDLILMTAKEQLADTQEGNLQEFIRLAKYYGLHPFFANAYWGAHWDLPNTSELFAMFGRKIITEDELRTQLTINDIHPDWIDRIQELAVRIPSRTEARLMTRVRKLTETQLTNILDAERIHDDYKEDYKFFLNNQELDTIRLQMARVYNTQHVKGYITDDDLTAKLARIPFSTDELESLQGDLSTLSIVDSPYSALEILATRKLNKLKLETEIKDNDLHSVKQRFLWEFKQGSMTKEIFREQISTIIVNIELADSIADNIMARAKTDFGLALLEALEDEP